MATQPSNPLTHAESLSLYERQTTFVSYIAHQNSEYLNVFDDVERQAFEKYFLPDWSSKGDFVHYYETFEKEDPKFILYANELLQKFIEQNNLDMTDLLLPQ